MKSWARVSVTKNRAIIFLFIESHFVDQDITAMSTEVLSRKQALLQ